MNFLQTLTSKWTSYRYRFVPWLAFNLGGQAKVQTITKVEDILQKDALRPSATLTSLLSQFQSCATSLTDDASMCRELHNTNQDILYRTAGFTVERRPSSLGADVGDGIFVGKAKDKHVQPGQIVALYPGSIYQPYHSIFFQSIGNQFIFRCADGCMIDGKDSGISGMIFRSGEGRDRIGHPDGLMRCADSSWTFSAEPVNPLNVGQYVNNANDEYPANVAYCELDVPSDFPVELRCLLPNVNFEMIAIDGKRDLKMIALVTTTEICQGDELLSSYFTLVEY